VTARSWRARYATRCVHRPVAQLPGAFAHRHGCASAGTRPTPPTLAVNGISPLPAFAVCILTAHAHERRWVGVALAAVTLAAMPPLAAAKRRVGTALGSAATTRESRQTMLFEYVPRHIFKATRSRNLSWTASRPS
jgi:hypothetical protein